MEGGANAPEPKNGMLEQLRGLLADPAPQPLYGLLRSVKNCSGAPVELQGRLGAGGEWLTIVPCVPPSGDDGAAATGGIWLPRGMLLRAVVDYAGGDGASRVLWTASMGEALDVLVASSM
jgi:hypothetical protein